MRAAAVLNRLLGFKGTVVDDVDFTGTEMIVRVRLRAAYLVCPCGKRSQARYDSSRRRWRHVDFGRWRVLIEAEIRRVDCAGCGRVRSEWMPWARPAARHTRDFEDMAAWLVKRMSKSAVAHLLGTTWETVDALVARLVNEHLDTPRLDGIYRIGVDEIAYRKGRKFLTVVADHDTGRVVFVGEGRCQHVFGEFFEALGAAGRARIEAVSMDMTPIYRKATIKHVPHAAICLDPFHVIKWAGEALDLAYQTSREQDVKISVDGLTHAATLQKVRGALRQPAEKHDPLRAAIIEQLRRRHPRLYRAWRLKEDLRLLYQLPADQAAEHLRRWINRARRSTIAAFVTLARRLRRHRDGILNAIHLQLSNSLVEGINAGIRLIQRRAHGYADLDNLIEMIHLCHGGISTELPTPTP
ncbi:ISL3 family transposase [Actinoplanes sp. TBRC 11911]|uniref:ISL3 family transposase n=1 Tax=Actinoplanes sp. TBRC 11911 TaxID=2729386 RepID=UPI00145D625B|nr:ISL3 family transposase [Actinoplanes sp. TBRC 11911]NMO57753.1 ISL3 family transposase [Actinoplanes sp. TBRC 11911]